MRVLIGRGLDLFKNAFPNSLRSSLFNFEGAGTLCTCSSVVEQLTLNRGPGSSPEVHICSGHREPGIV